MATHDIKSYKMLEDCMEGMIYKGLEYCCREAEKHLRDLVEEEMKHSNPKMYIQTRELLESISYTKIDKVSGETAFQCTIYYNTDKINAYTREIQKREDGSFYYKWGRHSSFSNEDVSEFIPLWIEKGTKNKHHSHRGYFAVKRTKEWLEGKYKDFFKAEVKKKYGITIK